ASLPPSSRRSTPRPSMALPRWDSDSPRLTQRGARRRVGAPAYLPDGLAAMLQPTAMSMSPFLRLRRATKHFGGVRALDAVDWEVMAGEVHCLVGENGSGKSTLIKLIAGVHEPDRGTEIEIGGTVHTRITPPLAKALGIHVIY